MSWAALKGQSVASVVSAINDSDFLIFLLWVLSKILCFLKNKWFIFYYTFTVSDIFFFFKYLFQNSQNYWWIILLASCLTLVSINEALGLYVDWLRNTEVVSFLLFSSLLARVLKAWYLFLKPCITYMYQIVTRILKKISDEYDEDDGKQVYFALLIFLH